MCFGDLFMYVHTYVSSSRAGVDRQNLQNFLGFNQEDENISMYHSMISSVISTVSAYSERLGRHMYV